MLGVQFDEVLAHIAVLGPVNQAGIIGHPLLHLCQNVLAQKLGIVAVGEQLTQVDHFIGAAVYVVVVVGHHAAASGVEHGQLQSKPVVGLGENLVVYGQRGVAFLANGFGIGIEPVDQLFGQSVYVLVDGGTGIAQGSFVHIGNFYFHIVIAVGIIIVADGNNLHNGTDHRHVGQGLRVGYTDVGHNHQQGKSQAGSHGGYPGHYPEADNLLLPGRKIGQNFFNSLGRVFRNGLLFFFCQIKNHVIKLFHGKSPPCSARFSALF